MEASSAFSTTRAAANHATALPQDLSVMLYLQKKHSSIERTGLLFAPCLDIALLSAMLCRQTMTQLPPSAFSATLRVLQLHCAAPNSQQHSVGQMRKFAASSDSPGAPIQYAGIPLASAAAEAGV